MQNLGSVIQVGGGVSAVRWCFPAPGSEGAVRPAADRDLSLFLTGSLHNREDVARALGASGGHPQDGDSDDSLIRSAYRVWGASCVERFEGEFAFVIHDRKADRVLAATDALGVKPLYYSFDGHRFSAGSRPADLLAAGIPADPCEEKIADYLSLAPNLRGGPRTFYRAIRRLEGGCRLEMKGDEVTVSRYWTLDPARENDERTEDARADRLRWLMEDAVRRRASDGPPFACALSGGFDSSCVAGLYRRVLAERGIDIPLETFSFELRSEDADEPALIEAVARAVNANHHHVYVDRDDAFEVLPAISRALDGPACDLGMLLLWRKKEAAARVGVKAILSGLGGDEVFLGRLQHLADLLRAGRLAAFVREFRGLHPVNRSTGERTSAARLLKDYTVLPLLPRPFKKYLRHFVLGERTVGAWIHPELARRTALADRIRRGSRRMYPDSYRQDCWETFEHELVGEALPAHAALGADVGVETRFPILDQRIVEFMFAAPRETKIREGHTRILQRRAMSGILPSIVVEEHRKKDFHPALARQQRDNFVRAFERVSVSRKFLSEAYVDWSHLSSSYRGYLDRGIKGWFPLLYAINLELWLRGLAEGSSREVGGA